MNAEELTSAIHAALEHNPDIDLDRYPIKVRIDDVVRLEGEVQDIIVKRKALRTARRVAGTARIDDRLRIAAAEGISDGELRDTAVKALKREPAFAEIDVSADGDAPSGQGQDWIRVKAEDGVVRLTGEVNSLSHRRLAEVIAWWVQGSRDVDNHLHVRPPEQENDAEISDAVRLVFDKEPALDADHISVTTRNREVTLRGAVFTRDQRRRAEQDCWYIPGVHAVHNELQVVSR